MAISEVVARLSVILGLDTAAFSAGARGVEGDTAKLQRNFEKFGSRISDLGRKLSLGLTAPLAAIGAAATASAASFASSAQTMKQAATVAGEGFESFQRLAFGASTVGVEADKLGDIFKDVRDKIGDFRTTGGGEMADFFENIAPKVGLTAEAFRGLSGKDGLQLYYDSLVKAGVSSDQMIFYLESIADDASLLIPLLENSGSAFEELGKKAAVLSEADAKGLKEYSLASKEFGEAIKRLTIAIANSGLLQFVTDLATRAGELVRRLAETSPTTLKWVLVLGAAAAALGPVIVGVGALTSALAPLAAIIVGTVIPGIVKFGWAAAAAVSQFGLLHGSIGVLTVSIRALMVTIAPWAAAIGAVAAAYYLLSRRAAESTVAAHAAELQSIRSKSAVEVERRATELLTRAKGAERAAMIASMQASRARAQQALISAAALRAEAANLLATEKVRVASERRRFEEQATFAGSFGATELGALDMLGGTAMQRGVSAAEAKLRQADKNIADLEGTIVGLGKAIHDATKPVALPALSASVDSVGKAAERAAGSAGKAIDPLQQLMDTLWPADAEFKQATANWGELKKGFDAGKLSADRYSDSVAQLWRRYLGMPDGLPEEKIESILGGDSIEQTSAQISARFADTMEKLTDKAGVTRTQVVKSFKDMADETLAALDRLSSAIQGGGFLGILEAVIGLGVQLGSMGLFGKGIAANINRIPGNANGTGFWRGGLSMVGERGPELVNLPRGASVTPNNKLGGLGGIAEIVPSPYFEVVVDGRIVRASPAIMDGSARVTASRAGRQQMRRLG